MEHIQMASQSHMAQIGDNMASEELIAKAKDTQTIALENGNADMDPKRSETLVTVKTARNDSGTEVMITENKTESSKIESVADRKTKWLSALRLFSAKKNEKSDKETLHVTDRRTGKSYNIPIENGAVLATDFMQISTNSFVTSLQGGPIDLGLKVLDPGFRNTACAESKITLVDGQRGKLLFRGVPFEKLYENNSFEEVAYLLIWNVMPGPEKLQKFRSDFAKHANPPPVVIDAIKKFPQDAPAFTVQIGGLAVWAASHPETVPVHVGKTLYMNNPEMVDEGVVRCFAALAAVTALAYCHQRGRAFTPAEEDKSIPENMLLMMGFVDKATARPDPAIIRHLDKLWILYADHEMTASTAAFLHVAATGADPLSCGTAALAAAAGPYHGGAIDMAYKRFEKLGSPANVKRMIDEVKAKKYRLPGVGHRLYRTEDPRGKFLRQLLEELKAKAQSDPLLAIALEIDRVVREDDYFTSRRLSINADLYGCLVYTALGFEPDIISSLVFVGRCAGVVAHWREAMSQPSCIWRPQQVYTGPRA